jgi:signal transduction histidine kinase
MVLQGARKQHERSAGHPRPVWARGLVALLSVVAALLLRRFLDPFVGDALPYLTLFGGVALAVWFSGWVAATAVALIGFLAVDYCFISPRGRFHFDEQVFWVGFLGYAISCGLIILFGEVTRRARKRAEEYSRSLERVQDELEKRTRDSQTQSELLETVVRRLQVGVALIRGSDLRIELTNDAYQEFSPGREILGKTIYEAWPEAQPLFGERCRRVLETGESYDAVDESFQIARKPGGPSEQTYFSWSMHRVNLPHEQGWGILVSAWDMTERKRMEDALREAQEKLQQRAAELEKLVGERTVHLQATIAELESVSYSLSHDMRAPLRTIQSFSQIVLADADAKLAAQEKDLLQRVISAAARLDRLIQDVLSYSKVAREAIQLKVINVEALIRQIMHERSDLQPPKVQIEIQSPLASVLGHEAYLTQCITNLLDNAVKFVASGQTPRIRIWNEFNDGQVKLWFEDNGIGIPKEAKERVFGMFQRVHAEQVYPGTGIGLSIVRKAAERMGGSAGVESEPGKGSRFWLQLNREK